jgi:CHASE1-domain containing sensor protein
VVIGTPGKARSALKRRAPGLHLLLPAAILLAGILITVAVSQLVRKQDEDKLRIEFDLLFEQTTDAIQDRIKASEQVLRGVRPVFRQPAIRETRDSSRVPLVCCNLAS